MAALHGILRQIGIKQSDALAASMTLAQINDAVRSTGAQMRRQRLACGKVGGQKSFAVVAAFGIGA